MKWKRCCPSLFHRGNNPSSPHPVNTGILSSSHPCHMTPLKEIQLLATPDPFLQKQPVIHPGIMLQTRLPRLAGQYAFVQEHARWLFHIPMCLKSTGCHFEQAGLRSGKRPHCQDLHPREPCSRHNNRFYCIGRWWGILRVSIRIRQSRPLTDCCRTIKCSDCV